MHPISPAVIAAQNNAESLFEKLIGSGMIQAGNLDSELSDEPHALAQARSGLRRLWRVTGIGHPSGPWRLRCTLGS
jgi:hypothetical protein